MLLILATKSTFMFNFASTSKNFLTFIFAVSLIFSSLNVKTNAGGYDYYSNYTPSYCQNIAATAIFYLIQPNSVKSCYSQYVYQPSCDIHPFIPPNCNQNQNNCIQTNNYYQTSTCVVANNYCDPSLYFGRADNIGVEKNKSSGTVSFDVVGMINASCNKTNFLNPVAVFVNVYDQNNNKVINNEAQYINLFQDCSLISTPCQNFRLSTSVTYNQFVNNTFRVTVGFLPNTSFVTNSNVIVGDYVNINTNYQYNNKSYCTGICSYYDDTQYYPVFIDFVPANTNYDVLNTDNCLVNTFDYFGACPIVY